MATIKAKIAANDSSFQKIVKIGQWIVSDFKNTIKGKPIDSILKLPMLDQYDAITKNQTPIWCGNYANSFLFFCKAFDIETRIVEIFNQGDHHVINECFLPELDKWISIDLTYNYLIFKDDSGKMLNTLDIINIISNNKSLTVNQVYFDTLVSNKLSGNLLKWEQYLRAKPDIYYYKETNPSTIYAAKEKIKRYILPNSYYVIFSVTRHNNIWFYIRAFFIYSFISLFLYLIYKIIKGD